MVQYRRNLVAGGTYFFTVTLIDRDSDILTRHIDALRTSVERVKQTQPFEIVAWVVLPDHLHAVWTMPVGDWPYSSFHRDVKRGVYPSDWAGGGDDHVDGFGEPSITVVSIVRQAH